MLKIIFVFFAYIFTQPAFAHGDKDFEEVLLNYENLVQVMTAYISHTDGINPADLGVFKSGDKELRINLSAMRQVLAFVEANHGLKDNPWQLHLNIKSFLLSIPKFIFSLPLKIYSFGRHPIHNTVELYKKIESTVTRYSLGYNPAVAIYILVSQAAWEAIESIIMPGGVHMFCTAFNMALLATALPMQLFSNLISNVVGLNPNRSTGLNFSARFRIGLRVFLSSFNRKLKEQIVVSSGRMSEDVISKTLLSDIDMMFDVNEDPVVRRFLQKSYVQGFKFSINLLLDLAEEFREHHNLLRHERRALARMMGRLTRIQSEYRTLTSFLIHQNAQDLPSKVIPQEVIERNKNFISKLTEHLDEFREFVRSPSRNFSVMEEKNRELYHDVFALRSKDDICSNFFAGNSLSLTFGQ